MRRSKRSYARETYYILCILGAVAVAAFTFWGPQGFLEMKKAQLELETRRARAEALSRGNENLRARIQALKTDRRAIEAVAREKGFVAPGEIVQPLTQDRQPKKAR